MNGIHDMGGMQDMGPIEVREDERPCHQKPADPAPKGYLQIATDRKRRGARS